MIRTLGSIVSFDIRSISRDHFLLFVILTVTVIFSLLSLAGHFRHTIGADVIQQWIPYVLILSLVANPASLGMVFGVFLIEEIETRVRAAIMTTPVSPVLFILMRTPLLVLMLTLLGTGIVYGMGTAWGATELSLSEIALLALSAALIGPGVMISISTFAANRIEAMAIGKLYSWIVIPPMFLYLLPEDAWYRVFFLVFPTTHVVCAYEAFRAGSDLAAHQWLIWGLIYTTAFIALSIRRYLRKSYGLLG